MPGKRQHYVPRFLLRRFAADPTDPKSRIWRLDKSSGRPQQANINNEAVIGRYYRIVLDDGTVVDEADDVLDRIETLAAEVVAEIAATDYQVTGDHVTRLMLFIVSLKNRTPQAREALREADERAAELAMEVLLSDRERYHRTVRTGEHNEADVEAQRLRFLEDLRAGRLGMESTPEREVALMFMGFEEASKTLFEFLDITCVRVAPGSKRAFVISDHPVSHYDPTPKTPDAGAGFMSSPGSVTWVPLDPSFGLLLGQQNPMNWHDMEATDEEIDELNVQTYAWARQAIYGPSQETVTRVRQVAKRNPTLVHELRYRPPRIWIARGGSEAGPHEFESRFRGQTVKRMLHVSPKGMEQARRVWPGDAD
jgi:hypothetical protein